MAAANQSFEVIAAALSIFKVDAVASAGDFFSAYADYT